MRGGQAIFSLGHAGCKAGRYQACLCCTSSRRGQESQSVTLTVSLHDERTEIKENDWQHMGSICFCGEDKSPMKHKTKKEVEMRMRTDAPRSSIFSAYFGGRYPVMSFSSISRKRRGSANRPCPSKRSYAYIERHNIEPWISNISIPFLAFC